MVISHFAAAIDSYRETGAPFLAAGATLLMLVAGSIPAVAARALVLLPDSGARNLVVTRGLLYLMFAVSPLYVLSIQLAARAGVFPHHGAIWASAWVVTGLALYFAKARRASEAPEKGTAWIRTIHGAAAACLLLGFLAAHLINHVFALWSVELHSLVMERLRIWYRSAWIEPALFALLATMIATGVPLVTHHSRRSTDPFRILQMATGVYIAMFLCAHLLAVLGARSANIETDWIFATGRNGLLDGRGMLIPYYLLAVFFVTLHAGCGLRIVLLKHGVAQSAANKAVYSAGAAGLIATIWIAIAAFGFQIQPS